MDPLALGRRPRVQTMKYINKEMFVTEKSPPQPYAADRVLCFYAFFREAVVASSVETERVRKCEISYFGDGTVRIVEPKFENSGVPQGTFMKRHRVPGLALNDLQVGGSVEIYGRVFEIYACNAATRAFLTERRGAPLPDRSPPLDDYEQLRAATRSSHGIRKNSMTAFVEAALGNTVDNSGRAGFLKYGTAVLRFFCYWDDRESLYGDIQLFKLHYFLYDNTIEVLTVQAANSGRDKYPLFLKRAKLPKKSGGSYLWTDLQVGGTVDAFSRSLKLIDADAATRNFYQSEGTPLKPRILPPIAPADPRPRRLVPPPTGFGSDEDSLTSCAGSLVQKAPTKLARPPDVPLFRYSAEFANPKPEDVGRTFVIVYDPVDRTVMVREPPKRNSGIVGGSFLAKIPVPNLEAPLTGARVHVAGHHFLIIDADEATLAYMERHVSDFPYSDPDAVAALFASYAAEHFKDRDALKAALPPLLRFPDFCTFLFSFVPDLKDGGPPKHAAVTLWRAKRRGDSCPPEALLNLLE